MNKTRNAIAKLCGNLSALPLCVALLIVLSCASGCGSGSGGTIVPTPTPTPIPTPTPTPTPQITSLSPSSVPVGNSAFTLNVTGTNFANTSIVQWNGNPRPTTFVSSTQLQAAIAAGDVNSIGTVAVAVATPGVGTGTTGGLTFTISGNPLPVLSSLLPTGAFVNDPAFNLTVNGSNFVSSSTVLWNGSARPTTFVSTTQLLAAIPAGDVGAVGSATVAVSSPPPGGGVTATPAQFAISPNPVPLVLGIAPAVTAGMGAVTLNITGQNFTTHSTVLWNGAPRPTTYVSFFNVTAAISAADVATSGTVTVAVTNPAPGGGASADRPFDITFPVATINQAANDLVYDSGQKVLYLSVPGSAATNPNTITTVDPVSATVTGSTAAGSNPRFLAIADDNSQLYAGIDGSASVQQFALPLLTKGASFTVGSDFNGPFTAIGIKVAPGSAHSTAITTGHLGFSPQALGGITIFDDGTARPTTAPGFISTTNDYEVLAWGAINTTLFAAGGDTLYRLTVNASGVTLSNTFTSAFVGLAGRIHYDATTDAVYSDQGTAVDAVTGTRLGTFPVSCNCLMLPDGANGAAYFLTGIGSTQLTKFNITTFTKVTSIPLPQIVGTPQRFIRWGTNGLAFTTDANKLYILNNVP
jgi:hypothetical protein